MFCHIVKLTLTIVKTCLECLGCATYCHRDFDQFNLYIEWSDDSERKFFPSILQKEESGGAETNVYCVYDSEV